MPTTLSQGEIAIVQYASDSSGSTVGDGFSFVLLTDVDAGTVINFTDSNFNTAGQVTNVEANWQWTATTSLTSGTVVRIWDNISGDSNNAMQTASTGTLSVSGPGSGDPASTGDQIFVYQGPLITSVGDTPNLLFGAGFNDPDSNPFDSEGWNQNSSTDQNESQLPTSLIGHEVAFSPEIDNGYYSGPMTGSEAFIYAQIQNPANWTLSNTAQANSDGSATWSIPITVCYCAGTRIASPCGEVLVETLKVGDLIKTAGGEAIRIKWIGHQTVSTRFGPAERLMPVRFKAGSLGDGVPHTDLTVTADHGMLVDGVICHAGALVNGTTITRVPMSEMGQTYTVYHIETEEHEIILANGAPAETFIDNVSRRAFDNYAEFEALYGDVPEMEELPFPRAMSARQVPGHIQARLAAPKIA